MTDLRTETLEAFTAVYGGSAASLWSAPGRVNLIGEHTDYNEGYVFPFAIDRRTFAAIAPRTDGMARVASSFADEALEIPVADLSPQRLSRWAPSPPRVAPGRPGGST